MASDAAFVVWGTLGAGIIALIVVVSTLGTTNANVMATARVTFAMGEDNRLFAKAAVVQPRFHTPGNALWLNAGWTVILIFSGSFDMLTDILIFVSWFYYGMSALGVLILRRRRKDIDRPYKVWGYPLVPLVFVVFTGFFLVATLISDIHNYSNGSAPIINSLLGVLITCIGLPVYFFSKK